MAENPKHRWVTIDQLCVGLFVPLDLSWFDHDFSRSSFKIKSDEQIAAIRSLGLERIRIDLDRSDCQPQPRRLDAEPAAAPAEAVAPSAAVLAKRARIDRINLQRAAVVDCEKKFLRAGVTFLDLQNEPEINIGTSLKPSQLTREVHEYLNPRKRMSYYFDLPKKDGPARA